MTYGFTITCNKCKGTAIQVNYSNRDDGLHFECMTVYENGEGCPNTWDEDFDLMNIQPVRLPMPKSTDQPIKDSGYSGEKDLPKPGRSRELYRDMYVKEFVITMNSKGEIEVTVYKGNENTQQPYEQTSKIIYKDPGTSKESFKAEPTAEEKEKEEK